MLVRKTKYQKLSRVQFAPDGRGLIAAGRFGAYWWPSVFDYEKAEKFCDSECCGLGFTPDGAYLLVGESIGYRHTDLHTISTTSREQHSTRIERSWLSLSVCPATGLAVFESWAGGEMSGWRVGPGGAPVREWALDAERGSIGSTAAFGPRGEWFVRAAHKPEPSRGYQLNFHDPATGATIRTRPGAEWVSAGPAVSP